jgi:hypothetical protein
MRRVELAGLAVLVALIFGCSSKTDQPQRSERERDSVLGQSALPGARGVRGALRASDSADARNARLDSVATQQ